MNENRPTQQDQSRTGADRALLKPEVAERIRRGEVISDWMTRRDAIRVAAFVAAYTAERIARKITGEA